MSEDNNKPKVLVIDDCLSDRLINCAMLELIGFDSAEASNGEEAIAHLLETQFDLILLDLQMPEINGMQFLMGFQNAPLAKETPVIVVSGNEDDNLTHLSQQFGAKHFIKKPLSLRNDRNLFLKYLKIKKEKEE